MNENQYPTSNWNHGALKVLPIEPQMTVPYRTEREREKESKKSTHILVQVRVFKRK